jgi:hypothetical protein
MYLLIISLCFPSLSQNLYKYHIPSIFQTNDFRGTNLPLTQAFMNLKEQQQQHQDQTDNQVSALFLIYCRVLKGKTLEFA